MEDRRQTRKPLSLTFQYAPAEDTPPDRTQQATLLDHSESGIRFEAPERLAVGTRLKLKFERSNPEARGFSPKTEGVVVWSIQPDPSRPLFRVGVKYV